MITRLVLVDGNPLFYRSYYNKQMQGIRTSTGVPSGGFFGFLKGFLALKKQFPRALFMTAFDVSSSWRSRIYPEYKAKKEKPQELSSQFQDTMSFLKCIGVPTFYQNGLEADDIISVIVRANPLKDCMTIVVSSDRDFFQLIDDTTCVYDDRAKVFYDADAVEELCGVSIQHFLNYKALLGDAADNIKGVPRYGPKKSALHAADPRLALSSEEMQIYNRNCKLMQLPSSPEEWPITPKSRKRLFDKIIDSFTPATPTTDRGKENALALLKKYECNSLAINLFY